MARIPLSARMNGISNLNTAKKDGYKEMVLDIDVLVPAHENFYSIEGIDELAENMLDVGHIEPIAIAKVDGAFKIVSGHRRYYALRKNIDTGHEEFRKVRCTVKEMSQPMYMLTLTSANAFTRKLDDATLVQQAEVMEQALQDLVDSGELKIAGKRRDYMASLLGVSSTKMAQVNKINSSLIEEGKEALASGEMNFSKAYETARLEPEVQKMVIDARDMLSKDVKEMAKKMNFHVQTEVEEPEIDAHVEEVEAKETVIKTKIKTAFDRNEGRIFPMTAAENREISHFLENYRKWGLWFHEDHIDADFYKYEASGGTFYVGEFKKTSQFSDNEPLVYAYFSRKGEPFQPRGIALSGYSMKNFVHVYAPEILKENRR